jgi:hypothetical protein
MQQQAHQTASRFGMANASNRQASGSKFFSVSAASN